MLFDIDGVIRDVSNSYRKAIQETVRHFSGWHPPVNAIDELKSEGIWNNDWKVSLELLKREKKYKKSNPKMPSLESIIEIFNEFYFGGDPAGDPSNWNGFILNEPLLVEKSFFEELSELEVCWGFVSGAERSSATFVLETRIGLKEPPLIAMGEAPEKPNPEGLISLANQISEKQLGGAKTLIAYVGDTVADVLTVKNARNILKDQKFISLAIAPPHLQKKGFESMRQDYEERLLDSGADIILKNTSQAKEYINQLKDSSSIP